MSTSIVWRRKVRLQGSCKAHARWLHQDTRYRLTKFFVPEIQINNHDRSTSGLDLLIGSGYIHQNSDGPAGIYHYLPLGARVLGKLENLIDKHMRSIGAAKLSLSSISTESAWRKSGRLKTSLKKGDHELFGLLDRKDSGLLLGPTHEEEITMMLTKSVFSEKPLPLRLYQVTRKYRNEKRPRAGLLRAKEFTMKDMYSFDATKDAAMETYEETRQAYHNFFTDLGLPFLVAEADSGNMGGNLSHEYHYESPLGEDIVWKCSSCNYIANDEVVTHAPRNTDPSKSVLIWRGISKDRKTLVHVLYPSEPSSASSKGSSNDLNIASLKSIVPSLDFKVESVGSESSNSQSIQKHQIILHPSISSEQAQTTFSSANLPQGNITNSKQDFTRTHDSDSCPKCSSGKLSSTRTIEVGHTFYLGSRYSSIFKLLARTQSSPAGEPVEMGCYGIGVSRIMGAIAEMTKSTNPLLGQKKSEVVGLNWPLQIAPFKVIIIAHRGEEFHASANKIYDALESSGLIDDVIIDDRPQSLAWKLVAADQVGYPIIVLVGKKSLDDGKVEIKCKALEEETRTSVDGDELVSTVQNMLEKLNDQFGQVVERANLEAKSM